MGKSLSIVEQAVGVFKVDSAATSILLGRSLPNSGRRMPPSALFTGVPAHHPIRAWTISIFANAAMVMSALVPVDRVVKSGEGYGGGSVVWGAKGALGDEGLVGGGGFGDAVDAGGFEGFVEGHVGEDSGQARGEHGFSGAGGADHEEVVSACGGDGEGAFDVGLAFDVGEFGAVLEGGGHGRVDVRAEWFDPEFAV